ncbi:MAG: Fe-S protein, homolog of lactate dehydrogenase SO1521, partial [uncultured Thermomicrobiales bacterium]
PAAAPGGRSRPRAAGQDRGRRDGAGARGRARRPDRRRGPIRRRLADALRLRRLELPDRAGRRGGAEDRRGRPGRGRAGRQPRRADPAPRRRLVARRPGRRRGPGPRLLQAPRARARRRRRGADRDRRAGDRPRRAQPAAQAERADVRARPLLGQPRHRRRRGRQQLGRGPLDPLRDDRRPRPLGPGRARRGRHRRARPAAGRGARRPRRGRRRDRPPARQAARLPRPAPRPNRPRPAAPLAAGHRLLAGRVPQARRRVQPGPAPRLLGGHPRHAAAGDTRPGADPGADGAGAAPVRRPGRLDGGHPGDPRDRALGGRADGPDADRSHPLAAGLRPPARLRPGRPGGGARGRVLRRRRAGAGAQVRPARGPPRPPRRAPERAAAEVARPGPPGRRLVSPQGRAGAANERPRRRQAGTGDRGRLGPGRAPRRLRPRRRGDGRRARHDRGLLRPRLGGVPPRAAALEPEDDRRRGGDARAGTRGGRAGAPLRRGDERRARRRAPALGAQRGDLRPRALQGDAPLQGGLRPPRADEPRQGRRRPADDGAPPLRAEVPGDGAEDLPRLHPRGRAAPGGRAVQRGGGLPQALGGDDVPLLHGDQGRGPHHPWPRQRPAQRPLRADPPAERLHLRRDGGGDGPLHLLQGLQDRVPEQRRHGQAQDRVHGPAQRQARHADAVALLRTRPHRLAPLGAGRALGQPGAADPHRGAGAAGDGGPPRAAAAGVHQPHLHPTLAGARPNATGPAGDAGPGGLLPRHLRDLQLPPDRDGGGQAARGGRLRGGRRGAAGLLRAADALQGAGQRRAEGGAPERRAARAAREAGNADRRHRAELHPDAARRVPRPPAERPGRGGGRPPGVHGRRVPGQARRGGGSGDRLAGRRRAVGALPRPLPPEGPDRGRTEPGGAAGGGLRADRDRGGLLRDGRLVRLRGQPLRGLAADRRGPPLPGGGGGPGRDRGRGRRRLLPAAGGALHRPPADPHRRGAGRADRPGPRLAAARRPRGGRGPAGGRPDPRGDPPRRQQPRGPGL